MHLTVGAGLTEGFKPWEGFNFWTFESWTLAIDVVRAFIALREPIMETAFLSQLSDLIDQATGLVWQVPIMVAPLFVLNKAGWFWELLT